MASPSLSARRTSIPVKPLMPMGIWAIVKNFIGKELTKVSIPVNFSEPLSMLQRLTEDFDYSNLLDSAANMEDDQQMGYVAAFAISTYSTTTDRVTKPFNPLLGETYECDRSNDLGWKCISEQVSHHPPISSMYCEGKQWIAWQDFTMSSKFRGKYLKITPCGVFHLIFRNSDNHYTWNKIITSVHNLILGTLWVDQSGTMEITNHTSGWKGSIEFLPYNYYNKEEQRCVKGTISDINGEVKWILSGRWDIKLELSCVIGSGGTKLRPSFKTASPFVIWERRPKNPEAENYYNFTLLACQLNEPEAGVAPTDSRNRPDQRLLEEGKWDEANIIKIKLEENQRSRKSSLKQTYEPLWFTMEEDPLSGLNVHMFNGKYWKCKKNQDWSACPDIYYLK